MTRSTAFRTRILAAAMFATIGLPAHAQVHTGAPLPPVMTAPPVVEMARTYYDATELDRILSPIALYPDPLLAQVLSAATFPSEIPVAMQWLDARRGRTAEQLANLLAVERVTWDPSVQSLIAFPTVLQMMATSMPWTAEIGDAFSRQRNDVMDAVQRLREQAHRYGYLQSSPQIRVVRSPAIEILPMDPAYVVVPYYNPVVVFAPPRPRFLVSSAIHLGFGVRLGFWYEPWGWRHSGFHWPTRHVIAGYPGWNRGRAHSQIVIQNRYDVQRYTPRTAHVVTRYEDRRDLGSRPEYRERTDRVTNGRDGRDARGRDERAGRDDRNASPGGRVAQPRVAQPRVEQPSPPREVRRTQTQATSNRESNGGYRRRN